MTHPVQCISKYKNIIKASQIRLGNQTFSTLKQRRENFFFDENKYKLILLFVVGKFHPPTTNPN